MAHADGVPEGQGTGTWGGHTASAIIPSQTMPVSSWPQVKACPELMRRGCLVLVL